MLGSDQFAQPRFDLAIGRRDRAAVALGIDRDRSAEIASRDRPGRVGQAMGEGLEFAEIAAQLGSGLGASLSERM